jgi:hypothetical protein
MAVSERSESNRLPGSDVIISALEKIVKAFEDTTQIDLIRQRWEEIKKLQDSKEILSNNLSLA